MEIGLLQKHILNLSPNLQKKQNALKTMLQEIAESRIKYTSGVESWGFY